MGDECHEDVIMELIKSKKKFKKSYFGAFPELKEFDRHEEEDDRIGKSIVSTTAKREGAKLMTGDPHFKGVKDVVYLGE